MVRSALSCGAHPLPCSRELSPVARTVYLSARTWKYGELSQDVLPYGEGRNIVRYAMSMHAPLTIQQPT